MIVVDHHVDGRSLRLQTATITRLSSGWSWRMAQVVPPQYPVLFVLKSNGKLRIYVDYRQFNAIIIKNRYTLSLIYEMQDRIKKSKIFTKINIRERYYKIRIKEGKK
jgi:hypothetical protein